MSALISDVRALLREFKSSPWRELHCKTDQWSIFFAREGAGANPMRAAGRGAVSSELRTILAEHLGLFEPCVVDGAEILEGQPIGTLHVLDRKTEVLSPAAGRFVIRQNDDPFVEFGDQLASVEIHPKPT